MLGFELAVVVEAPSTDVDFDPASLSAPDLEEVEAFLAAIDANEDVQHVYAGLRDSA